MTLAQAITAAYAADEAFDAACKADGYKSRWDWNMHTSPGSENLRAAYRAKIAADNAMHLAFSESRCPVNSIQFQARR